MMRNIRWIGAGLLGLVWFTSVRGDDREGQHNYRQGQRYFQHPYPTRTTDRLALSFYQKAVALLKPDRLTALMRFESFERIGILNQTFGNQSTALVNYRHAINTHQRFRLSDSLLFIPYLYAGSAHYYQHSFDSSSYYFERAERIYTRYPGVAEAQRLFNSLGALYYEIGNYRQSINYFQKAIQLYQRNSRPDSSALYSYKSNIASSLRHLQQYDSAAAIYQSLIPYAPDVSLLYVNLGLIYLDKQEPERALSYLTRANPTAPSKIMLETALGTAYLQLNQFQNARRHLYQALNAYRQSPVRSVKNDRIGLAYRLLGHIARQQDRFGQALSYYQRSIIELDYRFRDADPRNNPDRFTPNFGGYLLFESVAAKADCWLAVYRQRSTPIRRDAALAAYRSAFRLAEHIQQSFDNEEARLFGLQKINPVFERAITFLLDLHRTTGDEAFLLEAFQWSEQSKATVLTMMIKENRARSVSGIPDSLLSRERDLRHNRSRLMLKTQSVIRTTYPESEALSTQIRDTDLQLSRLEDKLNDYPEYYRQKFRFDSLHVDLIRRQWLDPSTALLSYYCTNRFVFGFVLTRSRIHSFRLPRDARYQTALHRLLAQLHNVRPGQAFDGAGDANYLHTRLIQPALPYLTDVRSLIVVPHDELRLLPFEALQDSTQRYLLETYDVTYQYSATLLQDNPDRLGNRAVGTNHPTRLNRILSIAPFSDVKPAGNYVALTASRREITPLAGTRLLGPAATKARFLNQAGHYSIIHLATHAVVDNTDPQRSFIAFYPGSDQHRLYAHELGYGLLANVELVVLSACETASGRLVRGEGLMSLSRVFSFAGCPNLITSLWKAEDNATAYISNQFYVHLRAGLSFSEALQRAKLDLLHNPQYAQFHAPPYWSHLIFIGMPPHRATPGWWLYLALATLLAGLAGGVVWYYRKSRFQRGNGFYRNLT